MAAWHKRHGIHRKRWAAARWEALANAGFLCQSCRRPGRLEVDHIQPLGKGGAPYDPANLQALCKRCHSDKTAGERAGDVPAEVRAWRNRQKAQIASH